MLGYLPVRPLLNTSSERQGNALVHPVRINSRSKQPVVNEFANVVSTHPITHRWRLIHRDRECWRQALCGRVPELKPFILQFDPPSDESCYLQANILNGTPSYFLQRACADADPHLEEGSWLDLFCRLIPSVKRYAVHFRINAPWDALVKRAQMNIMLHIIQSRETGPPS